jgi:preprotein translocase subunit SecE
VARNRKRAKDRRARRPGDGSQPGLATARFDAPDPMEHSAPDVELAEAQLALGRAELDSESGADEELDEIEFGDAPEIPGVTPGRVRVETGEDDDDGVVAAEDDGALLAEEDGAVAEEEGATVDEDDGAGSLVAQGTAAVPAEHRARPGNRLVTFLQGSWRELQRVQWPDRRQVMQATGVVIGFVIVAGVFLGVADFLAGKLVNYILK